MVRIWQEALRLGRRTRRGGRTDAEPVAGPSVAKRKQPRPPDPDAPTDRKTWNKRLAESASDERERWGLKDLDTGQSVANNPELEPARGISYERPGVRGAKAYRIHQVAFGLSEGGGEDGDKTDSVLIPEEPPSGEGSGNRAATGKKPAGANAVRIRKGDGTTDLSKIGNDEDAIREYLGSSDYSPALARRRSEAANQFRAELSKKVDWLLERDATQRAIASVLDCSVPTIRALRDEARAA